MKSPHTRRRPFGRTLLVAALGWALLAALLTAAPGARAATFIVTRTDDPAPGACDADCSLREAVIAANDAPGADAITLPPGTYVLGRAGSDDNASVGDLDVTGDLGIAGAGSGVTVVDGHGGATADRVFHVDPLGVGLAVEIAGVTVRGGSSSAAGGGILLAEGSLTLRDVAVSGNAAANGGGLSIEPGGAAALESVVVAGNLARSGGGLENLSGTVTMNGGAVTGNRATSGAGGGVLGAGESPITTLTDVTVGGNEALSGAGVFSSAGALGLHRVTVAGNRASDDGGGLYKGGGSASLTDVTVSGNAAGLDAGDEGGGIANTGGASLALVGVTVAGNVASAGAGVHNAAPATLRNTIVADGCTAAIALTSAGHNLDAGEGCGLGAVGDLTNTDPRLGPLADNGGSTQTHALLPGSPAIDAGDAAGCAGTTDQRGVARPQGATCDIGTFEAVSPDLAVAQTASPSPAVVGQILTYVLTATNGGPGPATGVTLTDFLPAATTLVSFVASQGKCAVSDVLACKLGALAHGASAQVTILVVPRGSGELVNVATADGDQPDGNPGNDQAELRMPASVCTITGSEGNDVLVGTPARDVICAGAGDDRIVGLGGSDLLIGGPGDDLIDGGPGDDRLHGQSGNDRLLGGPGNDRLLGGAGNDVLVSRDRVRDTLNGGRGEDRARVDGRLDRVRAVEAVS